MLFEIARVIDEATQDLKAFNASYYRDMLLRGHPAYRMSDIRDAVLMEQWAREKKYRPSYRSMGRVHFERAFQGVDSSCVEG